jgi:hypothetical protein
MIAPNLDELYERYIKPLPTQEQLRLAAMITRHLAGGSSQSQRTLLELEGLGEHVWRGVDPDQYVNDLRDEWGHRP